LHQNKTIKTTVIISVYKNTAALNIVLKSLEKQSIKPHEVIISEDGESDEMENFTDNLDMDLNIVHITQKDEGWRKNKALNNAIKTAHSAYLVFIDGDVVAHPRFIEGHLACSEKRRVCAGKRVELGPKYSQRLLEEKLTIQQLTKTFLFRAYAIHKDGARHFEDGIYVLPRSWIYKNIIQKKVINYLIGCNFSCYKEDIETINGFNEDYIHPAIGEDVDINWRFRASGTEVISCRNVANVYHLWHKKGFGSSEGEINNKILKENFDINRFVCLNGLQKLNTQGEEI
jgi:GT2 family glycosyltransferase